MLSPHTACLDLAQPSGSPVADQAQAQEQSYEHQNVLSASLLHSYTFSPPTHRFSKHSPSTPSSHIEQPDFAPLSQPGPTQNDQSAEMLPPQVINPAPNSRQDQDFLFTAWQQYPSSIRSQPPSQSQSQSSHSFGLSAQAEYVEQSYLPFEPSSLQFNASSQQYSNDFSSTTNNLLPLTSAPIPYQVSWQDLSAMPTQFSAQSLVDGSSRAHPNSPTDSTLDVRSLSSSDLGWSAVDYSRNVNTSFGSTQTGAIFNPGETLHARSSSESSYSDVEAQTRLSWGSYAELAHHSVGSPSSDGHSGVDSRQDRFEEIRTHHSSPVSHFTSGLLSSPVKVESDAEFPGILDLQGLATLQGRRPSPPGKTAPRSNSIKSSKAKKQIHTVPGEVGKKIGRRKGPLRPEQRKQASEIRKMGACLRCKFLKKTCDKQDTCEGCKPSHARLWQVPCTRVDIKDIAYFMRDWKADYELANGSGFSIGNIKGFSETEQVLFITHGYGHVLPIRAREIYVRDDSCFCVDWREGTEHKGTNDYSSITAQLSTGEAGISQSVLSAYLDAHINDGFENFVHQFFGGTPFVTEMLLTVHRYYKREKTPIICKALKFLLAYNLTQHITMVEGIPVETSFPGRIEDEQSQFYGKTVAPVMINVQVKTAMASLWRDLQKDVLEELQSLYQSIYSKEKLRNWPTIFMLASVLLTVWEEMQFDCHFRVPDKDAVHKFCNDMEAIPVKVIVGLFTAISQKLPSFQEWDSGKHHAALASNSAICDALTEVRQHVNSHDSYLRARGSSSFDPDDFDSLSSKFVSKLVIRSSTTV